jgi:hypothetical protein
VLIRSVAVTNTTKTGSTEYKPRCRGLANDYCRHTGRLALMTSTCSPTPIMNHTLSNNSHEHEHGHGHGHGQAHAREHACTLARTTTKCQRPTSTSTNVAPLTHTHAPNTLEARVTTRHAGSDQAATWRTSSGFGIDASSLPMHMQHQNAYTCAYMHTHDRIDLCRKEGYLLIAATCPSCHSFGRRE